MSEARGDSQTPMPSRPYRGPAPYAFICYAHADNERLSEELHWLSQAGVRFWFDEGISPGELWREEIANAIRGSALFVYFVTPAAAASRHCQRECSFAIDIEHPMISVYLAPTDLPDGLRLALADRQAILAYSIESTAYRAKLLEVMARHALAPSVTSSGSVASHPDQASGRSWRRRIWVIGVASAAILLAALVWLLEREPPTVAHSLTRVLSDVNAIDSPVISRDGAMLAYVRDGDVFTRRVAGGRPIRLTETAAIEGALSFSPDGERIVFDRMEPDDRSRIPDVYVMPTLGGPAVPLVERATSATFSADGSKVAYVAIDADGMANLTVAGADGRGPRLIHRGDATYRPYIPAWSPDGKTLGFVRSIGGSAAEIWLIDESGANLRPFKNERGVINSSPVFTPDGKNIVHTSSQGGAINVWRTPLRGGAAEQLTTGPGPDGALSVADDGTVAFQTSTWKKSLLLYEDPHDSPRELFADLQFIWAPVFSPDGRAVAYSRAEPDGTWHIWQLDIGDHEPVQLTSGNSPQIYPRYTPDGEHIVYFEWVAGTHGVWKVPSAGGAPVRITAEGVDASYADVSPDGSWLAYVFTEGADTRIHIRAMAGGEPRVLVDQTGTVPRWSPDGSEIAFTTDRSWERPVFVVRVDGSGLRRVTERGGFPVWWPDGSKLGFLVTGPHGGQRIATVTMDTGATEIVDIEFTALNSLFDVSEQLAIVTTDSTLLANEVWLLR